jgi:hypothetical protein
MQRILTAVFRKCWRMGQTPSQWKESHVRMLHAQHSIRHRRLTVGNVLVKYGAQEFERWYFGTKGPGGGSVIACGRWDEFLFTVESGGSAIDNHNLCFAGTVGVMFLLGVGEQHSHEVLHLQSLEK